MAEPVPSTIEKGTCVSSCVKVKGFRNVIHWTVTRYDEPKAIELQGRGRGGIRLTVAMNVQADHPGIDFPSHRRSRRRCTQRAGRRLGRESPAIRRAKIRQQPRGTAITCPGRRTYRGRAARQSIPLGLANPPAVHRKPGQAGPEREHGKDRGRDPGAGLTQGEVRHADNERQRGRRDHQEPGRPLRSIRIWVGGPIMVDRAVPPWRLLCCHIRLGPIFGATQKAVGTNDLVEEMPCGPTVSGAARSICGLRCSRRSRYRCRGSRRRTRCL